MGRFSDVLVNGEHDVVIICSPSFQSLRERSSRGFWDCLFCFGAIVARSIYASIYLLGDLIVHAWLFLYSPPSLLFPIAHNHTDSTRFDNIQWLLSSNHTLNIVPVLPTQIAVIHISPFLYPIPLFIQHRIPKTSSIRHVSSKNILYPIPITEIYKN